MKIKNFFKYLKHEINNAKTGKALKLIDKRAQEYKDNIMKDEIKNSLKSLTLKEYKKLKKAVIIKSKYLQ